MLNPRSFPKVLALALAILVAVGLWKVSGRPTDPSQAQADTTPTGQPRAREPEESAITAPPASERVRLESGDPRTGEEGLKILFLVRNVDGEWNTTGSGRVLVYWNRTHEYGRLTIEIVGGAAALPPKLPREAPREWLEFDYLRLDGRRAVVLDVPKRYPPGHVLSVDCEYLAASTLVVLDGPGGNQASGLQIAVAAGVQECELAVPLYSLPSGPSGLIKWDLTSPIPLEDQDGTVVYFVRSKRSAWSRIAIDHETPGTRIVTLQPGGAAEFTLIASSIPPNLRLRVYAVAEPGSAQPATAACLPDTSGRALVEGMRVGEWEVRAEVGNREYDNPVLGSRRFFVAANSTTQVELPILDLPAARPPVRVYGVFHLPEPVLREYVDSPRFRLQLQADDPRATDYGQLKFIPLMSGSGDLNGDATLVWDAGDRSPGPCKAQIGFFQWCDQWMIKPDEENFFNVDLGELQTTRIQLVDPETGASLPIQELRFQRTSGPDCNRNTQDLRPAPKAPGDMLPLQVLDGPYWFEITGGGSGQRMTLDVPGLAQCGGLLTIPFTGQSTACIAISLQTQGMSVPLPFAWWNSIGFRRADGAQVLPYTWSHGGTGLSTHGSRAEFRFISEGPLAVHFPPVEDFQDIPQTTVVLAPGETRSVSLELQPAY